VGRFAAQLFQCTVSAIFEQPLGVHEEKKQLGAEAAGGKITGQHLVSA
jgi:hypothetical protein